MYYWGGPCMLVDRFFATDRGLHAGLLGATEVLNISPKVSKTYILPVGRPFSKLQNHSLAVTFLGS